MGWQKTSGYNDRALIEADISRWKRVIGDGLRSQTDERQATEVAIAAAVLNRMLELDLPNAIYGLRFTLPLDFRSPQAAPRRSRAAAAG